MPENFAERTRWAAERLGGAQKSGPGVPAYTRWVNRRLGRFPAAAAYGLGLAPNHVTVLSAVVSACGIALVALAPLSFWAGVVVAILLAGGYALDSADGQLARVSGKGSPAGEWLDHVVDAFRMPALHLAVAVGLYRHLGETAWLLLPLGYALLTVGHFFSQILAEQLRGRTGIRSTESPPVMRSFLLLPTDTGTLCWLFVLWGMPAVFIAGYLVLFVVNILYSAASMRRKYRALAVPAGAEH